MVGRFSMQFDEFSCETKKEKHQERQMKGTVKFEYLILDT